MRIGIDCRLWNETGVGRYIRNLVWNLAEIDKKNEYILFFRKNEFLTVEIPKGKFEKKLADFRWHSVSEQLGFANLLNKQDLDLVHFPYFSVPVRYKKPYVVTIHDLIIHNFPTGEASTLPVPLYQLKLFAYKYVIQQAAKRAEKIIAVSRATKEEVVDHLGIDPNKITVTYEGADGQIANSKLKIVKNHKLSPITHLPYFLYVGNMYPHKNVDLLVDAFAHIAKGGMDIKLVLVGKEDYFSRTIRRYVNRMGLSEPVVFAGEVSDEELVHLYHHAWALVCPSKMEGFGLPLLEAMANKCLVIASDIPVFKEIGAENVLYFKNGSELDLAEKMQHIIVSPKEAFKSYIIGGYKRAGEFSWEKMARETLKIYESSTRVRSSE